MTQLGESERIIASEEHVGRACPYCRFPLKKDGELAVCGYCRAAHHADCWSDNGGCAVMGCAAGPDTHATATQPTVVMPPPTAQAPAFGAPPTTTPVMSSMGPQSPQWPPPQPRSSWTSNTALIAAVVGLALAVGGVAVALVVTSKNSSASTNNSASVPPPVPAPATSGNSGSASNSSAATGNSGTGSSATANTGTGNSGTGNSATGNSGTGNSGTGNSGTGNSGTGNSGSGTAAAADAGSGPAGAIKQYWQDVNNGDFTDAVNMETPSEQSLSSVSTFQSEQPHIHVLWVAPAVSDGSGQATVRVNFYAHNTIGSDQTCRHFSIDSLMVQSGGQWLYDGHAPGSNTVDQNADGDPNCPS